MTAPTLPSVPDYKDETAPTPTSATTSTAHNPSDIWGLAQMYGQPVFLGVGTQLPTNNAGGFTPGKTMIEDDSNQYFGSTQGVMKWAASLFAQQAEEQAQNPDALTGFEQLQQALWAAGAYKQTSYDKVQVGGWTKQTQDALKTALGSYETAAVGGQQPMTFTEFLSENAQADKLAGGPNSGASATAAAPPQVSLTDPNDIREAVQQAAQDSLGFGLSSTQLASFVSSFQAKQSAAETSTAAAVTAPDLQQDASAYVQSTDPGAYKANQKDAYTNALLNMFLPAGSTRPNIDPVPAVGG